MSTLQRTAQKNAFRINNSGFTAALTKRNGIASDVMRRRVLIALSSDDCPVTSVQFKRLENHWYVFVGSSKQTLSQLAQ